MKTSLLVTLLFIACTTQTVAAENFPPGWLPLSELDDQPTWSEVREIKDRIHLYLPDGDKPVRGVFACFVFHSGDPRELADLWNFALVTGSKHPYSKIDGKWGGQGACGLGYGDFLSASETHVLSASVKGDYEKVLFHDGNQVLGETTVQPWTLPARKLEPGLRVLFAVGVKADGSHSASQPTIVIVK
ncbi:MAG: hypothetical protein VCG02_15395 [Verrucomicrobiota bacterium]